jgi:hypothetical protein
VIGDPNCRLGDGRDESGVTIKARVFKNRSKDYTSELQSCGVAGSWGICLRLVLPSSERTYV